MRTGESRIEYTRRFHRVTEYIDRHLDESLDLATLAEVAHFSPFHFHRLFAAWMGETLGDYVRRRRLEVGATRLAAQPRLAVLDVALSVGFGSSEAFSRAFKERFGRAPTAWRHAPDRFRDRNPDHGNGKTDQAGTSSNADDEGPSNIGAPALQVRLIDRGPVRIAFLRHVGPYGPPLGQFWRTTVMPWVEREGLGGRPMYGIGHDHPGVTAPDQCRADAGVEVADDYVPTGDAQVTTLSGGRYATTRFVGTAETIPRAWAAMMRDWLPSSGLQLDARPMFEYYGPDSEHDAANGRFSCDITIPVAPLCAVPFASAPGARASPSSSASRCSSSPSSTAAPIARGRSRA